MQKRTMTVMVFVNMQKFASDPEKRTDCTGIQTKRIAEPAGAFGGEARQKDTLERILSDLLRITVITPDFDVAGRTCRRRATTMWMGI
jgi:hypothetical protein